VWCLVTDQKVGIFSIPALTLSDLETLLGYNYTDRYNPHTVHEFRTQRSEIEEKPIAIYYKGRTPPLLPPDSSGLEDGAVAYSTWSSRAPNSVCWVGRVSCAGPCGRRVQCRLSVDEVAKGVLTHSHSTPCDFVF
jgi:hypothetical protein